MSFTHIQKTAFRQKIESYLKPDNFRPVVEARLERGSKEEVAAQKNKTIARWQKIEPHMSAERMGGKPYVLSKTCFGRHHNLLTKVRDFYGSFGRPINIFMAGAGMYPLHHMPLPMRWYANDNGISTLGLSYEMAEMALIAGVGGSVTVTEIDPLVVSAMKATFSQVMMVDLIQPLGLPTPLITAQNMESDSDAASAYDAWKSYLFDFCADAAVGSDGDGILNENGVLTGLVFQLQSEIANRVTIQEADVGTVQLKEGINWAWLVNVGMYIEDPIWWSLLVRTIKKLNICHDDTELGHLTVNDIIKGENMYVMSDEIRNVMHYFFNELVGMEVQGERPPPLETGRPNLFTARRIEKSSWIDEQYENIREAGLE